jgi:hypothetical protein
MSTAIMEKVNKYDSAAAGPNPYEANMTAFEQLRLGWSNTWLLNFPVEVDESLRNIEQENVLQHYGLPRRLTDPSYGRDEFDVALDTLSAGAPAVDDVWRITQRIPVDLSKLLSDDRNNE